MSEPILSANLSSAVRAAASRALDGLRVAIPARVVAYDGERRVCDVQPLAHRTLQDGSTVLDPGLKDVPILYPGTRSSRLRFPLTAGDTVLLIFCDRSLDEWADTLTLPEGADPKDYAPNDSRRHSISDAVAVPIAVLPTSLLSGIEAGTEPDDRLLVEHGDSRASLASDGKVAIGKRTTSETVELLALFDQVLDALDALTGFAAPDLTAGNATALNAVGSTAASVRTELAKIKGVLS